MINVKKNFNDYINFFIIKKWIWIIIIGGIGLGIVLVVGGIVGIWFV